MKAAKLVRDEHGGSIIGCFVHTLQLDITPTLIHHIPSLHSKVRSIFNKFAHSSLLQDELQEKQKSLGMDKYVSLKKVK